MDNWLAELAMDRDVLCFILSPTKLFLENLPFFKICLGPEPLEKNNLCYVARIGPIIIVSVIKLKLNVLKGTHSLIKNCYVFTSIITIHLNCLPFDH